MAETRSGNAIADGIPMDTDQMRDYLQQHYGIPIALKEQGATAVTCPYCKARHPSTEAGHQGAACEDNGAGIVIGGRFFFRNYGCTVFTYRVNNDGVKELTVPDNLLD